MSEPTGFKNIEPRTREDRYAKCNKESLEKQRLRARTGGFQKMDIPENLIVPEKQTPAYLDAAKRYDRDAAAAEYERKQHHLKRKEDIFNAKREGQFQREQQRWDAMQNQEQRKETHMQTLRSAGAGDAKNKSAEHFDIISLNYNPTPQGEVLKYKDEKVMHRAALRAQNLYSKNQCVSHNIITGEPLAPVVRVPPPPVAPWDK